MDKETFANHISKLGKRDFDIACNFVLHEIFSLIAVNVDGRETEEQILPHSIVMVVGCWWHIRLPLKRVTLRTKHIMMRRNHLISWA